MAFSYFDMEFVSTFATMLDLAEDANVIRPLRRKLDTITFVKCILYMAKTSCGWKYLSELKFVNVHYQTVYKRYEQLVRRGVIKRVWVMVLNCYSEFMLSQNPKWFEIMSLDATMVNNITGSETVGKNHYDRYRLGTKMSAIVDQNRIPVSLTFYPANRHDARTTILSVNAIECRIKLDRRFKNTIGADSAYVSRRTKTELKNQKIDLVAAKRRNMATIRLTSLQRQALRQRIIVEHTFCHIKKFKRVKTRSEKNIASYASMQYFVAALRTFRQCINIGMTPSRVIQFVTSFTEVVQIS